MSTSRKGRESPSELADEHIARKKERLDSTIYKLKVMSGVSGFSDEEDNSADPQISGRDSRDSSDEEKEKSGAECLNKLSPEDIIALEKCIETNYHIISKDNALDLFYCMWENTSNVCWLDASMALLAHNQTLRYETELNGSSQIIKIIKFYNEAVCTLNNKEKDLEEQLACAKKYLYAVQETSLKFLKPRLKYNEGEPDSAFCSFYNLICEDKMIKKYFEVTFTRSFLCEKCGKTRSSTYTKPLITLPKVAAFQPSSPVSVSECPACKAQDQRINIIYKRLPKCLVFHFEGGAGKGELQPLDFTVNDRHYKVTGLMTLEKAREMSIDHFVSWIRDPSSDSWLECNDLNPDVLKFSVIPPQYINLEEVCMIMFEAFDDLATIEIQTAPAVSTEKFNLEDEEKEDENIPFIDLSQDNEDQSGCISDKTVPTKDVSQEKSSIQSDPELEFLRMIGFEGNDPIAVQQDLPTESVTVEVSSDGVEQKDLLRKLDLQPKSEDIRKRKASKVKKPISSENIQFEDPKMSLQDTLSPRYTDIIMKLAQKDDEIERKKIVQSKKPSQDIKTSSNSKDDEIEENEMVQNKKPSQDFKISSSSKDDLKKSTNFSESPTASISLNEEVDKTLDGLSIPDFSSTFFENKESVLLRNLKKDNPSLDISLISSNSVDNDKNVKEAKKFLEQQHVKLTEILLSKHNTSLTVCSKSSESFSKKTDKVTDTNVEEKISKSNKNDKEKNLLQKNKNVSITKLSEKGNKVSEVDIAEKNINSVNNKEEDKSKSVSITKIVKKKGEKNVNHSKIKAQVKDSNISGNANILKEVSDLNDKNIFKSNIDSITVRSNSAQLTESSRITKEKVSIKESNISNSDFSKELSIQEKKKMPQEKNNTTPEEKNILVFDKSIPKTRVRKMKAPVKKFTTDKCKPDINTKGDKDLATGASKSPQKNKGKKTSKSPQKNKGKKTSKFISDQNSIVNKEASSIIEKVATVPIKQAVIKLFKLTSEDLLKYTSSCTLYENKSSEVLNIKETFKDISSESSGNLDSITKKQNSSVKERQNLKRNANFDVSSEDDGTSETFTLECSKKKNNKISPKSLAVNEQNTPKKRGRPAKNKYLVENNLILPKNLKTPTKCELKDNEIIPSELNQEKPNIKRKPNKLKMLTKYDPKSNETFPLELNQEKSNIKCSPKKLKTPIEYTVKTKENVPLELKQEKSNVKSSPKKLKIQAECNLKASETVSLELNQEISDLTVRKSGRKRSSTLASWSDTYVMDSEISPKRNVEISKLLINTLPVEIQVNSIENETIKNPPKRLYKYKNTALQFKENDLTSDPSCSNDEQKSAEILPQKKRGRKRKSVEVSSPDYTSTNELDDPALVQINRSRSQSQESFAGSELSISPIKDLTIFKKPATYGSPKYSAATTSPKFQTKGISISLLQSPPDSRTYRKENSPSKKVLSKHGVSKLSTPKRDISISKVKDNNFTNNSERSSSSNIDSVIDTLVHYYLGETYNFLGMGLCEF